MPKLKTNKGARKRFHFTATGKIKRKKAFLRHMLTSKESKAKRGLRHATLVHPADKRAVRQMMPYR